MPEQSLVVNDIEMKLVSALEPVKQVARGVNMAQPINLDANRKLIFKSLELSNSFKLFVKRFKLFFKPDYVAKAQRNFQLALKRADVDLN